VGASKLPIVLAVLLLGGAAGLPNVCAGTQTAGAAGTDRGGESISGSVGS